MLAVSAEPIVMDALVRAVRTDACGAVVTFAGVVRETSPGDPRPVVGLRYEAYTELALAQIVEIAAAARASFGPLEIAIVHRTGELRLGETSIAIAAPHRGVAFDACEYAIDTIKAELAVWKQELYADGDAAWRANTPGAPSEAAPSR
jgi:molybdopterin synthase catalytic subunit